MMKLSLTLVAATLFANFALAKDASPVQPPVGGQACFKRVYSDEHMKRHPKQQLSSMYIEIKHEAEKSEYGDLYTYRAAKLVGVSKGEYYTNDAGCEYRKDGSIRCGVDCDGGGFNLKPRATDVLFVVAKDYYFPFYKNGTDQETATDSDVVSLGYDDLENRTYRLDQAPVGECRAAQKRARIGQWGC